MGRGATFLLLAGLCLAAGFAGGYVVGQGDGGADATDPGVRLDRAEAQAANAPPPTRLAEPQGAALEGALTKQLVPLREALALIPEPLVERGDGVLTGVVKTEEGDALAGVKIRADPRQERSGRRDAAEDEEPPELAVRVREWVQRVRAAERTRRETTTGPDGTFRLTGLADLPHHVRATLDGWQIQRTDEGGRTPEPGATLAFEATRIHEVEIHVTLPGGGEPDRAQVSFKSSANAFRGSAWRPEDRRARLDPGVWEVTATAGEAGEYHARPHMLQLDADGPMPVLHLALEARPVVRGRVRLPKGQELHGSAIQVRIAPLADGQEPDPARLGPGARGEWVYGGHRMHGDHDFTFTELTPGPHLVGVAFGNDAAVLASEVVQVVEGLVEVDLEVPPLPRDRYVLVRVRGPDGKPLPDVQLQTGYRTASGAGSSGANAIRLEDGSFQVLHPHAPGEGITCWIRVVDPRYGAKQADYDPAKATRLDLDFGAPGVLTLRVAGVEGSRYAGRVHARLEVPDMEHPWQGQVADAAVDAQGEARLGAVQPGTYMLVLTLTTRGRGPFGVEVLRETVRVAGGEETLSARLPPLYDVAFENAEGSVHVQPEEKERNTRPWFAMPASATTDGRATFEGLPAGTYIAQSGRRRATFTVPGATTVRLAEPE